MMAIIGADGQRTLPCDITHGSWFPCHRCTRSLDNSAPRSIEIYRRTPDSHHYLFPIRSCTQASSLIQLSNYLPIATYSHPSICFPSSPSWRAPSPSSPPRFLWSLLLPRRPALFLPTLPRSTSTPSPMVELVAHRAAWDLSSPTTGRREYPNLTT